MLKTSDIVIDVDATLGRNLVLTAVRPAYKYVDGKATGEIEGYRYDTVAPQRGYEKVSVKILGKQQIELGDDYPLVRYDGLELYLYTLDGRVNVGARATDVRVVKGDNGKSGN